MLPPSTDGFFDTIVGTMDNMQMFTDLQAQAAVRDGTAAIEVLVVQQDEDGQIKLLSKEHSRECYQLNIQPSIEESRVIAAQRLRLPSTFSQNYCIDAVIKELEEQMGEKLFEWLQSPVLQGELFPCFEFGRNRRTCRKEIVLRSTVWISRKGGIKCPRLNLIS